MLSRVVPAFLDHRSTCCGGGRERLPAGDATGVRGAGARQARSRNLRRALLPSQQKDAKGREQTFHHETGEPMIAGPFLPGTLRVKIYDKPDTEVEVELGADTERAVTLKLPAE